MKIKIRHIAPIILVVFVVGIAGTIALNMWSSELVKEPAKYTSGDFEGQNNPSDIRGSYTFADINRTFNVPVEDLAKAFGFKDAENPEMIKAKDVEGTYGVLEGGGELGTDSIRMFVAYYLGLPFTAVEDNRLPRPAVSILRSTGKITEEQLEFLEGITVDLSSLTQSAETPADLVSEHEQETEFAIKGKTTFKELLDFGITEEEIETILGMPMGRSGEVVRDYVADKGLEFSEYKVKFEELIAAKK